MQLALAPTALALAAALAAPADDPAPEADLAYHGRVTMTGGHVTIALTPQNHGPFDVPDATVRLAWSSPLADTQTLPDGCLRSAPRTVSCRTGALPAAAHGTPLTVRIRLADTPSEVTVRIDTTWSGGPADHNPDNDRHQVLVLDTGDTYYF
ncbi:hypothetical protein [Streptomyces sp. cg35]|uniref:hypothetical protein n=1 Tax=Streptomyces sp. cg35 TaxID=3421650 RepID=UPI003D18625C